MVRHVWELLYLLAALAIYVFQQLGQVAGMVGETPFLGFGLFFGFLVLVSCRWNSFLNPFVFLLPLLLYFLPGLYLINSGDLKSTAALGWILMLSIAAFWLGWASFLRHGDGPVASLHTPWRISPALLIMVGAALVIWLAFGAYFSGKSLVVKALFMSSKEAVAATLLGLLFCLAVRSVMAFHMLYAMYALPIAFFVLTNDEVSRFSVLRALFVYFVALVIIHRAHWRPLSLRSFALVVLAVGSAFLIAGGDLLEGFGGDVLVLSNARDVVEHVAEGGETFPGMPMFNAGFVLVPDGWWPVGEKPKYYNPSAWYIDNVLGISPGDYEWGVGLGGVGAAYLYGGWVAVFLLYALAGMIFGFMSGRVRNVFLMGMYVHFLVSLPFALYRMDESFLFGMGFVTIPFILMMFSRHHAGTR